MNDDAKLAYDVPAAFWEAFHGKPTHRLVNPKNHLERITTYDDRKTYENWQTGYFAVSFNDGRVEAYSNVHFNADDLLMAVARTEGKDTEA